MIESEVKFSVPSLTNVATRLAAVGAPPPHRQFERNRVFDTPSAQLAQAGQLLRLREDDRIRLTHKSPLTASDGDAKHMEEIELCLSDAPAMAAILKELGYTAVRIYEKYRQTVELSGVHVCLDTLPFGSFVELEGAVPDLQSVAAMLELPWQARILDNYFTLFQQVRTRLALNFENITFDAFKGLSSTKIDFHSLLMEPPDPAQ